MSNKKGFSLLSFLIYLMLFSLMTFFICHMIVSLVIPSLSSLRKTESIIALHIATDLFVRDIQAGVKEWKVLKPHELIWKTDDSDIGWSFIDNQLKRTTGLYDKGWKNRTTSIVATGVLSARFQPEKSKNSIIAVELVLEPKAFQSRSITCYVATIKNVKV